MIFELMRISAPSTADPFHKTIEKDSSSIEARQEMNRSDGDLSWIVELSKTYAELS